MNIVVLDGHTLNPGDLSWNGLEALGECTIYDRTPASATVERAQGAEIVLTNKTVVSAEAIRSLKALRYISILATGYNIVDIDAAKARGIPVSNVPTYGTESVAQMVFAHVLNLTQNVAHHAQTVSKGRWSKSPDFCYWDMPLVELHGLTLGIVGLGRIGQVTARIGQAFGMQVIGFDVVMPTGLLPGIETVELDEVFRRADVISLHCPLAPETERLVNRERLGLMKPTAFLINTSRGPLIDDDALAEALNTGRIAGAGLDVLTGEPPKGKNPLFRAKNCFITPHIAWATRSARQRLLDATINNVAAFLRGRPQNVVNGVTGETRSDSTQRHKEPGSLRNASIA